MANLGDSIRVGSILLNNRLVMPPMKTGKADAEGGVTDELVRYYAQRAEGGCIGDRKSVV